MNELNKKLAEWAGFREADIKKYYYWEIGGTRMAKWVEPETDYHMRLPNFTHHLDACFKWLVSKAVAGDDYTVQIATSKHRTYAHITPHYEGLPSYKADHEEPALAICLAVEKKIDGGK